MDAIFDVDGFLSPSWYMKGEIRDRDQITFENRDGDGYWNRILELSPCCRIIECLLRTVYSKKMWTSGLVATQEADQGGK
jgi:hypothetical protein